MQWSTWLKWVIGGCAMLFGCTTLALLVIANSGFADWFTNIFPQTGKSLFFGVAQITLFVWLYGVVVKVLQYSRIPFHSTFAVKEKKFFKYGNIPYLHFGSESEKRRGHHSPTIVFVIASVLSLILFWCFLPFVINSFTSLYDTHQRWAVLPYTFCLFLVLLLAIVPLPPFWSTRLSFTAVLGQVFATCIVPPFWGVSFVHVMVADILTSASLLMWEITKGFCIVTRKFSNLPTSVECSSEGSWGIYAQPVAFGIPFWIRFVQCLYGIVTTFHHGCKWSHIKHYVNALKYLSGLAVIIVAFFKGLYPSNDMIQYMWIGSLVIKTTFCYLWDVYADWNLEGVSKANPYPVFLRNRRLYHNASYYVALVTNFFMRWSWSIALSSLELPAGWSYIMALVEIGRRMQWMVFRIENEYLTQSKASATNIQIEDYAIQFDSTHEEDVDLLSNSESLWANNNINS